MQNLRTSKAYLSGADVENRSTVFLEDLDVFDEFENRFNEFLKSTPYIE